MKKLVIDACVAIKWFIPEIYASHATRLWHQNIKLLAPDLIFAEMGNILWKKQRLQEITQDNAHAILHDFKRLPLEFHSLETLLDDAWELATTYQCTFYDSLYVALAHREKCLLVTADQKLMNLFNKTTLAASFIWIENLR